MIHEFPKDHDDPQDSQVIICITGNADYIRESLKRLLDDYDTNHKPCQGVYINIHATTSVTTPIWNGKPY